MKRTAALILCVVFCLAMSLSAFFIVVEANHECCGEDCHICLEISSCAKALHRVVTDTAIALAAVFTAAIGTVVITANVKSTAECITLISLKVKLSD